VTVAELNALDDAAARRELARCCGSRRWVAAMSGNRPFKTRAELLQAADDCWWSLDGSDWLEAFAGHPRIGERAAGWAGDEQSGVAGAGADTLKSLAKLNHDYERRFGHVFLICATGKSADEMLGELILRLENDPRTELRTAAAEQAKITRLRLEKLLGGPDANTGEVR
jgi:OHCU decarboxylase